MKLRSRLAALAFLSVLHPSTSAHAGSLTVEAQPRIWLYDGRNETYETFRCLVRTDEPQPVAVNLNRPSSWPGLLGSRCRK